MRWTCRCDHALLVPATTRAAPLPSTSTPYVVLTTSCSGRRTNALIVPETAITSQHTNASRENRDRHLAYGDSLQQAMDQLEQAALSVR